MGYSARLGYGTETSHVDLIMLKGKDDENSLQYDSNFNRCNAWRKCGGWNFIKNEIHG